MDVKEIRAARLRLLMQTHGNTQVLLGKAIKKAPAQISQWFNGTRKITEETAREIERNIRLPIGWLDQAVDIAVGSAPTARVARASEGYPDSWPFRTVSMQEIHALSAKQLHRLEQLMRQRLDEFMEDQQAERAAKRKAA